MVGELGFPYTRREIDDLTRRMFTHALQHIDQVSVDINALQFAGHDQALDPASLVAGNNFFSILFDRTYQAPERADWSAAGLLQSRGPA
jgi:hypothetical protein